MPIKFNGSTDFKYVTFNGTRVEKVKYNNVTVWEASYIERGAYVFITNPSITSDLTEEFHFTTAEDTSYTGIKCLNNINNDGTDRILYDPYGDTSYMVVYDNFDCSGNNCWRNSSTATTTNTLNRLIKVTSNSDVTGTFYNWFKNNTTPAVSITQGTQYRVECPNGNLLMIGCVVTSSGYYPFLFEDISVAASFPFTAKPLFQKNTSGTYDLWLDTNIGDYYITSGFTSRPTTYRLVLYIADKYGTLTTQEIPAYEDQQLTLGTDYNITVPSQMTNLYGTFKSGTTVYSFDTGIINTTSTDFLFTSSVFATESDMFSANNPYYDVILQTSLGSFTIASKILGGTKGTILIPPIITNVIITITNASSVTEVVETPTCILNFDSRYACGATTVTYVKGGVSATTTIPTNVKSTLLEVDCNSSITLDHPDGELYFTESPFDSGAWVDTPYTTTTPAESGTYQIAIDNS